MNIRKLTSYFLILSFFISCRNEKSGVVATGRFITAENGMVVSAHEESSKAGIKMLLSGGNAVDAAAATELALAVCYPEAGNIGGGGFMLIRMADGAADVIDYREKAPLKADRDMYLNENGDVVQGLSTDTHLACGVPGTVAGIIEAHGRYGKLPFRKVIEPAIELAEKGFRLSRYQANSLNNNRKRFIERNRSRTAFVKDSLWKEGDILRQPELANTLRRIRDRGKEGFYSGKTAELIVNEMVRGNGLISLEDLAAYNPVWRKPLTGIYRNYGVITIPPPSAGGIILLQLLDIAEDYPMKEMGFHSTEAIHLIIEAEKRVFADRAEYVGDPDFVNVPVKELLNKTYLRARMKDFSSVAATPSSQVRHGNPFLSEKEETTHYSVVDKWGNAVAATTTLNGSFGNSIVVEGAGFLLNNEMDDFSSKPGYPNMYGLVGGEANSIKPGKRMLSSMTPAIITKENSLFMVLGSPGGSTIPTSVFQVIINVLDYGMDIRQAVEAGRFHNQWLPDQTDFEPGLLAEETISKLKDMGHTIKWRGSLGRVNALTIWPDGLIHAGADPRGNNSACGY
ncbi:MAG: gamma-glutamyltransferase [Bacteroidales bacterium]|nr:gamma-glutamyltransferase [Bacteroidales bacterium]